MFEVILVICRMISSNWLYTTRSFTHTRTNCTRSASSPTILFYKNDKTFKWMNPACSSLPWNFNVNLRPSQLMHIIAVKGCVSFVQKHFNDHHWTVSNSSKELTLNAHKQENIIYRSIMMLSIKPVYLFFRPSSQRHSAYRQL